MNPKRRPFLPFGVASLVVHGALLAGSLAGRGPRDTSPGTLHGETFALPGDGLAGAGDAQGTAVDVTAEEPQTSAPGPSSAESAEPGATAVDLGDLDDRPSPAGPRPPKRGVAARPRSGGRAAGGGGSSREAEGAPSATTFGAVGDRGAVDLATTFTRSFPMAASADPAWQKTPLGSAGSVEIALLLDESGHLTGARTGAGASPALAEGIRRTVALIRGRTFTARGATTRLVLRAQVAPDQVHDGLHGDVFAIGGSFTGGGGHAFFALAMGRRIDLAVSER